MTLQPPLRSLCWLILLAYVTIFVATEAWCYADAITAAPRLVSTHVPLFAILYHLHLLRMYVRRWARTRTL